eukprot:TRINITY_DN8511_c0_g1_i1.p1 TRINITY_DN8511_c0_g1~~TRINITY_DN8511_c0_g1_i1.p1  ORF type:complete len:258 (+),score=49.76 TRINITY_DN8511_c0_g1_i1:111-776(+)
MKSHFQKFMANCNNIAIIRRPNAPLAYYVKGMDTPMSDSETPLKKLHTSSKRGRKRKASVLTKDLEQRRKDVLIPLIRQLAPSKNEAKSLNALWEVVEDCWDSKGEWDDATEKNRFQHWMNVSPFKHYSSNRKYYYYFQSEKEEAPKESSVTTTDSSLPASETTEKFDGMSEPAELVEEPIVSSLSETVPSQLMETEKVESIVEEVKQRKERKKRTSYNRI